MTPAPPCPCCAGRPPSDTHTVALDGSSNVPAWRALCDPCLAHHARLSLCPHVAALEQAGGPVPLPRYPYLQVCSGAVGARA